MSATLAITWLGHSTFLIVLPNGKRIVTDPWFGNPKCPSSFAKAESLKPVDLILVSHGHSDHTSDVAALSRATHAPIVCQFEVGLYFMEKGLHNVKDMGVGGTQDVAGVKITMTQAAHSSSFMEGSNIIYLGTASGYVLRAPDTPTIYFAGDTGLFGDMKIIGEIYKPEIAFLPIGDHYTMGPETAAIAAEWLGVKQVVPMHWGTFPVLTGTPAELKKHLGQRRIEVLELKPGETAK
jgi:L-ascorbate metabolism protein UlaG (beta-lactamase superfamily)